MANDVHELRVALSKTPDDFGKSMVLDLLIADVVATFQLDADGEIVAATAVAVERHACVPGSAMQGDVLNDLAIATNEQMRRDAQAEQGLETGIIRRIKTVGEQSIDGIATKAARRQAYRMHDNQFKRGVARPRILIGGRTLARWRNQTSASIDFHPPQLPSMAERRA